MDMSWHENESVSWCVARVGDVCKEMINQINGSGVREEEGSYRQPDGGSRRVVPVSGIIASRPISKAEAVKSTGAWASFTFISRILFTLVPVSLLASRKISAKRAKYARTHAPVDTPPSVQRFYTTFCEAESSRRPTRRDVRALWNGKADGSEVGGEWARLKRKAVFCPDRSPGDRAMWVAVYKDTVNVSRQRTGLPPLPDEDIHFPENRAAMWFTPFIYLPELPAASRTQLEKMTLDEREQLFEVRCHEAHKAAIADKVKKLNKLFVCFIVLPFMVFAATAILSLERTPYSGRQVRLPFDLLILLLIHSYYRWRFIMLSPEEEDAISERLRGPGWYQTVISLLTTAEAPAPPIVPTDDWRWHWVNSVLRRLEKGVLAECSNNWSGQTLAGSTYAVPPPPEHPLHPRPRAACMLHAAVPGGGGEKTGTEHLAVGPPYSLLLLQDEERNALSMGWGGDGAGGVVVYTGILDEILADPQEATPVHTAVTRDQQPLTWFQSLIGRAPDRPPPLAPPSPTRTQPVPTEEQTIRLACVLAHELAHLLLAHHLEALSASQVLVPNVTGLASDLIRTIIFPVTMILGPFVNDFISDVSKMGMDQSKVLSDVCFSRHQEREADLVGLRLLAYAGYDPEVAIKYWEHTPKALCGKDPVADSSIPENATTSASPSQHTTQDPRPLTFFRGVTHDSDEVRLEALLKEIERWKAYAERNGPSVSRRAKGWVAGMVPTVWT
ncbi:hypothetical protein QFC22_002077 [Naganishia vaughanmartiniae]|uniref:Uncharacterized protein n=1 Tax=Naganishia vaughanmartiniae TaxID=1424756 RepID=A0ACC2XCT9_9TREE|nr:hypothetical protein QFC22_002077 [Naganishia vaughanmartiniae]